MPRYTSEKVGPKIENKKKVEKNFIFFSNFLKFFENFLKIFEKKIEDFWNIWEKTFFLKKKEIFF